MPPPPGPSNIWQDQQGHLRERWMRTYSECYVRLTQPTIGHLGTTQSSFSLQCRVTMRTSRWTKVATPPKHTVHAKALYDCMLMSPHESRIMDTHQKLYPKCCRHKSKLLGNSTVNYLEHLIEKVHADRSRFPLRDSAKPSPRHTMGQTHSHLTTTFRVHRTEVQLKLYLRKWKNTPHRPPSDQKH